MTGTQLVGALLGLVWLACPRQRSSGRHDRRYQKRKLTERGERGGVTHGDSAVVDAAAPATPRSVSFAFTRLVRHQPSPGCPGSRDGAGATFPTGDTA